MINTKISLYDEMEKEYNNINDEIAYYKREEAVNKTKITLLENRAERLKEILMKHGKFVHGHFEEVIDMRKGKENASRNNEHASSWWYYNTNLYSILWYNYIIELN